jgi:ketosteroid isomerase-like protein
MTNQSEAHTASTQEDAVRVAERERLRALVEVDMERASRLHADDFQLITPAGDSLSRQEYLEAVASGQFDYLVWDPGPIAVRLDGNSAVIRYRSEIEIVVNGSRMPRRRYWHTDSYERQDGQWQAVWSQATEIRS